MDLEKTLQRINNLENEVIALKKAMSSQSTKVNKVDEKTTSFLNNTRDLKTEMGKLNTAIGNLGHLDPTIKQLRLEFNRKIEDTKKSIVADSKMQDNLRIDEMKAVNKTIEKNKKDITNDLAQKLKQHVEEVNRIIQRSKDLENSVMEKIRTNEEMKSSFNVFSQEFDQHKKKINAVSMEIDNLKKIQDDFRQKQENTINSIRTNDSRMTEIIAADADRKQTYNNFIEQQTLTARDRERIWKEWQQQFDDSMKKIYQLIPELQNQQLELNKSKVAFDEINLRFDRRINEVTELYRLLDEKFRQEWATYKSDSEKKWSNVSVVLGEKQDGFTGQLNKIKERMLSVEDSTNDMQEVLLLMSKEIQKGMQGLMNMVNGWMEAFGEIKSPDDINGN